MLTCRERHELVPLDSKVAFVARWVMWCPCRLQFSHLVVRPAKSLQLRSVFDHSCQSDDSEMLHIEVISLLVPVYEIFTKITSKVDFTRIGKRFLVLLCFLLQKLLALHE